MIMQDVNIKNEEFLEKLDALAIEVDKIFNNQELIEKHKHETRRIADPELRKEDNKDEIDVAPHFHLLPWNLNDDLKEGQMNPVSQEYLDYMKQLMIDKGPRHAETAGFPNLEPFISGRRFWEDNTVNYEYFRKMIYDVTSHLGGISMALCAFYPPGTFIPWHHNGNAPGHNILLHYNKEGKGNFYTYDDDKIITYEDKPGWVCRAGIFYDTNSDPETHRRKLSNIVDRSKTTPILADHTNACWHAADAFTNRFTLSTVIPDYDLWQDIIEELEES